MSAVWFDAWAFGALKDDFAFSKAHLLDVFFGGIAFRHRSWIRKHRLEVTRDGEEYSEVEDNHVEIPIDWIRARKKHDFHYLKWNWTNFVNLVRRKTMNHSNLQQIQHRQLGTKSLLHRLSRRYPKNPNVIVVLRKNYFSLAWIHQTLPPRILLWVSVQLPWRLTG